MYAIEVWGNACKTEINKLEVLQKRAMRMMTYNDSFPVVPGPLKPSDPIFHKLNILKINDIYKFQVAKFIFRNLNNLAPVNFQNWFCPLNSIHNYHTRSNFNTDIDSNTNNLVIPFARTSNYGLKQICVNGPRIWNALPDDLRLENSKVTFLRKLKNFFTSGYYQVAT